MQGLSRDMRIGIAVGVYGGGVVNVLVNNAGSLGGPVQVLILLAVTLVLFFQVERN